MENNANRKFCANCGAPLQAGMKFCNHCGSPVPQQAAPAYNPAPQQNAQNSYNYGGQGYNYGSQGGYNYSNQNGYNYGAQDSYSYGNRNAYAPAPEPMTKQQYRKACANPQYRKSLKTNAIIMYVLAGLNLILSIAMNPMGLLDVAITLGLALGMHIGKSKGCAIGILIYSIVNMIILIVMNGSAGGWLWLVLGIASLKTFSIADKEYEATYGK